jgi:hypothetical protein
MKPLHFALCASLLGALACEKPKDEPTTAPTGAAPTTAPTPTTTTVASAGNPDDGEGIPTEEDFEDEAEQKITSQNAADELDKLEKEIAN